MTTHEAREFIATAAQLGWSFVGMDGRGHLRLHHLATNQFYAAAATPSDGRSRRNTIADLERLSGRKLPRANSGHYHHQPVQALVVEQSAAERRASEETEALVAEAQSLRRDFNDLTSDSFRNDPQISGSQLVAESLKAGAAVRTHTPRPGGSLPHHSIHRPGDSVMHHHGLPCICWFCKQRRKLLRDSTREAVYFTVGCLVYGVVALVMLRSW